MGLESVVSDAEHFAKSLNADIVFSDDQCRFLNENIGVSRRTLKDVLHLFNAKYGCSIGFQQFQKARLDAIDEGRCRTTYVRNYYKSENTSDRQLREQKPVIRARLTQKCQYWNNQKKAVCGADTPGRFCENHAAMAHKSKTSPVRGPHSIDGSLGRYG